jgi:hypothetical protein
MILDRPPKNWKRPPIPTRVKIDVIIRQEGKCKQTGDKLGTLKNTQFDHRPALFERQFDTVTNDTIPPANDPAFIEACTVAGHKVRTHGTGATTVGSDSHRRAKIKRFTEPKTEKPKREIPRRLFPPGRKFPSRVLA